MLPVVVTEDKTVCQDWRWLSHLLKGTREQLRWQFRIHYILATRPVLWTQTLTIAKRSTALANETQTAALKWYAILILGLRKKKLMANSLLLGLSHSRQHSQFLLCFSRGKQWNVPVHDTKPSTRGMCARTCILSQCGGCQLMLSEPCCTNTAVSLKWMRGGWVSSVWARPYYGDGFIVTQVLYWGVQLSYRVNIFLTRLLCFESCSNCVKSNITIPFLCKS